MPFMGLKPWRETETWLNPLQIFENLQEEMGQLFNFSLAPFRGAGLLEGMWSPAIDLHESRDNIIVKADIPGMNKEEMEVYVHDNTLVIKGEKKREHEIKEEDYVRMERFHGTFNRAITLPAEVDANNVKATYKNGVLEITLNKKEEAKTKQIKVEIK